MNFTPQLSWAFYRLLCWTSLSGDDGLRSLDFHGFLQRPLCGRMGDYAQDQQDELEALESIYSEEISIIGDSPHRSQSTTDCLNRETELFVAVLWIQIRISSVFSSFVDPQNTDPDPHI